MRKLLLVWMSVGILIATAGCSSTKERDDWQQYRAKKGQDELSADVAKQKGESK